MRGLRRSSLVTVVLVGILNALALQVRAEVRTPGHEATQWLFYLVLVPAIGIGVLVMALVTYAVLKFRVREGHTAGPVTAKTHDRKLETIWTVVPALILLVVGVAGFQALLVTDTIPENPDVVVEVTAQRFLWNFNTTFPGNPGTFVASTEEVTVQVGQIVKLVFRSIDVGHAFYIPAYDLKIDVLPGRDNEYWFRALVSGDFTIQCAEYCGVAHYTMIGMLHVVA